MVKDLRQLAALLPADDAEMESWLSGAMEKGDTGGWPPDFRFRKPVC
jgi:hypothetical protein